MFFESIVIFFGPHSVWMVWAECVLGNLDRPPIQRLGLVILALGFKQDGEVVVEVRNGGMIVAENLFVDLDGSTIEPLGLIVLTLVPK